MKKRIKRINTLSLYTLISLIIGQACVQNRGEKALDFEAEIDAYVKPYVETGGYSGAILIAKDGEKLLSKGYGMANYEFNVPNTPKTKFQIASISKTFTAAAIMILQERGKLSVYDSLSRFIPDYPKGDKITICHLLIHTSGIPNVNAFPDYNQKSRFPQALENIIAMFKEKPLIQNPGEKYSYSNSNYNLLAYIIEKVSGISYREFLKENIFDPLDMRNTGHHGDASAIIRNLASGYQPSGSIGLEKAPFLDWSIKTGNGSLYSTVEDLYKWDRALYTEKILKKSSLDDISKEHLDGIGYGWFVRKRLNRRVTAYNGRSPGYSSYLERYIDDDACIIILSNNYAPAPHMMIEDLAAILFSEEYEGLMEIKPVKINSKILSTYVGSYKFGDDFYRPNAAVKVIKKDDHLSFQWSKTYITPLRPLSENKFLERFFWAYIIFKKNTKGEVTGLIWRDTSDYLAMKLKED